MPRSPYLDSILAGKTPISEEVHSPYGYKPASNNGSFARDMRDVGNTVVGYAKEHPAELAGGVLSIPAGPVGMGLASMAGRAIDKTHPFTSNESDYTHEKSADNLVDILNSGVVGGTLGAIGSGLGKLITPTSRMSKGFVAPASIRSKLYQPDLIPAPKELYLPEGTMVGNPIVNRLPGTKQGDAYLKYMEGTVNEGNHNPEVVWRGGKPEYDHRDLAYGQDDIDIYGSGNSQMSESYRPEGNAQAHLDALNKILENKDLNALGKYTRAELEYAAKQSANPKNKFDQAMTNYMMDVVNEAGIDVPNQGPMYQFYNGAINPRVVDMSKMSFNPDLQSNLIERALEEGKGGVIMNNYRDAANPYASNADIANSPSSVHVIFDPTALKSKYNIGTWDRSNRDQYLSIPAIGAGLGAAAYGENK